MGSRRINLIILMMFCGFLFSSFVEADSNISSLNYNPNSLNSFIYNYTLNNLKRPRTGRLYNISLPSNFSDMEVSFIRLRTNSFWTRGINSSVFQIPPKFLPWPYVRRLDIVYHNLGNLSALYYNVPNYTFVAPVVGFITYDSNTRRNGQGEVQLVPMTKMNPILVQFPNVSIPDDDHRSTTASKCVRFSSDGDGVVEMSNVTRTNSSSWCVFEKQGHFSIVVPIEPSSKKEKNSVNIWKWWVIGFGVGIVALVLILLFGILILKIVKVKRIGRMERESERSEALDTAWIGNQSRMPSASSIRTQPVLENNYVP